MSRDVKNAAMGISKTAQDLSSQSNQAAQGEIGTLAPALTQEATTGLPPEVLAAMNTATQQSAGGANAGAAGQGALMQERTRNAGAATPAIEESARDAMRQGSNNSLAVQLANEAARQQGLSGLQGLYGTNTGASLSALGLGTQALNTANAASPGWLQNTLGIIQALKPGGSVGPVSFGGG